MSEEAGVTDGPERSEQTYERAVARLDQIISRLDSGDAELRETLDLCTEAKGLIEYCAGELTAVGRGLRELRLEDLAASLTEAPDTAGTDGSRPDQAETGPGSPVSPAPQENGPDPDSSVPGTDVPF